MEFDSEIHEELFALFILTSNAGREITFESDVLECKMNELIKWTAESRHPFMWEDRSLFDEEFEGWVESKALQMVKEDDHGVFGVYGKDFSFTKNKIKFRFEV